MTDPAYLYNTFWALYHGVYLPLGLHTGPRYTGSGHPGYDTARGLAAFLHVWARDILRRRQFTGQAWGVHLGPHGTLQGSYLVRLRLHHWMLSGHRDLFTAWIHRSLICRFVLRIC
jgi:hypothetical protein